MKNRITISLIILPTLALCCFVVYRVIVRGPADTRTPQALRFQAATNQMALWDENAEYQEIRKADDFKSGLRQFLKIKNEIQITPDQDSLLKDSIYDFLMAFHEGNYSDYEHFRMAAAGGISPKHLTALRNFVSKKSNQPLAGVSALPNDELFRIFVELRSKGKLYRDYFSLVSFKKSQVEVDEFRQIPTDLKTSVFNGTTNLGVASFEPMFTFDRNPEIILQQDKSLICATAVLYVKTKEPSGGDMPAPVYLRLTWDGESKKWLPSELAMGNIWQKSEIILAF
jgi:hypothetical protein